MLELECRHGELALLLSDLEVAKINLKDSKRTLPTEDKLLMSVAFSALPDGASTLFGMVVEGQYLAVDARGCGVPGLLSLVHERSVVLKPASDSGGGRGVHVLSQRNGQIHVDGAPITIDGLEHLLSRHPLSVVTDHAQQAGYAEAITPGQASTIRIMTVRDDDDRPYVAWAGHEFMTSASAPSKSFVAGALCADIDLSTGRMGAAAQLSRRGEVLWHRTHPDSGAQIEGIVIPHWHRTLGAIAEMVARLPQLRIAGWDVIVTDDGPRVLEGERHAITTAIQIHKLLLADPVVARFLSREQLFHR